MANDPPPLESPAAAPTEDSGADGVGGGRRVSRLGAAARVISRRRLFGLGIAGAIVAAAGAVGRRAKAASKLWLRPPGALAEDRFVESCARCFKCVDACPNACLEVHGLDAGLELAFTPYLEPRSRACILCGACADACPTGALEPFEATPDGWLRDVDMGLARVNEDLCYSFHGRTCGACYRACPLAGTAIKIGVFETPYVQADECVGCGLCEQACLHLPQAIRVIPRSSINGGARRRPERGRA